MRFSTLDEWLSWQETLHPSAIDLGLERTQQVWRRLQHELQIERVAATQISVAGTNGKGSSVAMLEAIYSAAGYRVASYTSPHLVHYNERLRVAGAVLDEQVWCDAFARVDAARAEVSLTYFEFGTLAAFVLIAQNHCDVALLEVGLGGRLDAVNIVDADVALLTSIGIDHTAWLGDTREQIGFEKAGIMRADCPAVVADAECPDSVTQHARSVRARLLRRDVDFSVRRREHEWDWLALHDSAGANHYSLPYPALRGAYQIDNAAGVLAVVNQLHDRLPVSRQDVSAGLVQASCIARFQEVGGAVSIILDVAHNPQAVQALVENLSAYPVAGKTCVLFAALNDKDVPGILRLFSGHPRLRISHWFLPDLHFPRALAPEKIAELFEAPKLHNQVTVCSNVETALKKALKLASTGDRIVVFGSFVLIEQAMKLTRFS